VQGLVATVGAAQRTYDTARHKVIYITNVRKALLQRLREYATAPTGTVFDRQIHISITPAMAQRGCHVLIASDTAVTGIFNLHIPAQTTHGDVLRMVGAGASSTANGQDQRGSMLVTVQIDDAAGAWPWNVDNEPDPVVVMPTRTVEHAPRLPKTPPAQHPRHPYVRTAFYLASLAVIAGAAMPLVIAYRDAQAAYLEASSDLSIPGWLNRRNAARVNQREVLARRDLDYLRAHLRAYGTVINQAPVHAMIAELQAEHDRRVLTEREEQRAQHLRTAWALPDPQALLLFAQANAGTPDAEAALAEYRRRIDAARAVEAERAAAAERRKRELETKAHAEAWAKAAALAEKGRAFGVWSEQSVSLRTAASGTDIVRSLREGAEVAQAADRMAEYAEILADTQRRTIPRLGVFVDNGSVPKRVADIRLLLGEPMQRNATGDMWVYGDYTMTIEGNYMVQVQLLPKRAKP
jgi:hypothetical protein